MKISKIQDEANFGTSSVVGDLEDWETVTGSKGKRKRKSVITKGAKGVVKILLKGVMYTVPLDSVFDFQK